MVTYSGWILTFVAFVVGSDPSSPREEMKVIVLSCFVVWELTVVFFEK